MNDIGQAPRILVCGGRDFNDWNLFRSVLDEIVYRKNWICEPDQYGNWLPRVVIISGAARGADTMAIEWSVSNWCPFIEFPADWKTHGNRAGPIRNQQMIDEGKPDLVVAFPGGKGTADMIKRAKKAGIELIEV